MSTTALTHVSYDPNDRFGIPSALLALAPQALIVSYVTTLYVRREWETAYMFAGQLGCEALNWVLKRLIKQERPSSALGIGKGYGMPSSHAQFMGYFAAYLCVHILARPTHSFNRSLPVMLVRLTAVVTVAVLVCASRVYLAYHTVEQVLVGVTIGIVVGLVYSGPVRSLVRSTSLWQGLVDSPPAKLLHMKDTITENALVEEWEAWSRSRSATSTKLPKKLR